MKTVATGIILFIDRLHCDKCQKFVDFSGRCSHWGGLPQVRPSCRFWPVRRQLWNNRLPCKRHSLFCMQVSGTSYLLDLLTEYAALLWLLAHSGLLLQNYTTMYHCVWSM